MESAGWIPIPVTRAMKRISQNYPTAWKTIRGTSTHLHMVDGRNPANHQGCIKFLNYGILTISTGVPSTVCLYTHLSKPLAHIKHLAAMSVACRNYAALDIKVQGCLLGVLGSPLIQQK